MPHVPAFHHGFSTNIGFIYFNGSFECRLLKVPLSLRTGFDEQDAKQPCKNVAQDFFEAEEQRHPFYENTWNNTLEPIDEE